MCNLSRLITLLIAIGVIAGCGQSQLEARKEMSEKDISFTQETFFEGAYEGKIDTLNLFLAAGMDPNSRSEDGATALLQASIGGHIDVVRTLLQAGASPHLRTDRGETAIELASREEHSEIKRLLEEARAQK